MDYVISYNEIAALVANPPSLAPRTNFRNLHNLRCHTQCALMRVSFPQSNILRWARLIMSRAMYGLLTTTPFWLPTDPEPLAIYYPAKIPIVDAQGDPVLDQAGVPAYQAQPAIGQAEQATIDATFKCTKKFWKSYMNIRRAVFNCLDDGIDDAFKVSNDPALTGWNALMEPREMFDQIMATYGRPSPAALLQHDMFFRSVFSPQDAPKVLF